MICAKIYFKKRLTFFSIKGHTWKHEYLCLIETLKTQLYLDVSILFFSQIKYYLPAKAQSGFHICLLSIFNLSLKPKLIVMRKKTILFCLLFIIGTGTDGFAFTQSVNVGDSLALVDLYNATNGPAWNHDKKWLKGPVSKWYGITTKEGRVTEIDLTFNNLNGTIPPSFSNLSSVTSLNLYYNHLRGDVFSSISKLPNLAFLNLSTNELNGSIPSSIGDLKNLRSLNLYWNQLSGSIPPELGKLVNLYYLSLNHNQLRGGIPPELGNLKKLIELKLNENQLSDSIPSTFANLTSLTSLSLNNNQLSGSIPTLLGNLEKLEYFYLHFNNLSGELPASLGNLINLKQFYLTNNQVTGSIPLSLGNLFNLEAINFSGNQLSGSIPSSLGNLINLKSLDFSSNQLSGSIPSSLGNLLNLSLLELRNNFLTGNIPPSLGNLTNLSNLWLANNFLSGAIPIELGNLTNLGTLDLSHNNLSDNIPSSLGNLHKLYDLEISNNQLTGSIPSSLGNSSTLRFIYLDSNKLDGVVPVITNLDLFELDIFHNYFTFNGMELIAQTFYEARYNDQASIPIHQNGNALFVSAGGTLSNNTYKWFHVGVTDSVTITGDSVFYPSEKGKYFAAITNSIAIQLTLYTDTIDYGIVLPVTIINLKAQQQGSIIKIDWASLTEINIDRFEIQRSINANDFVSLGSITPKGSGIQISNYTFNDIKPLMGNNYYRIQGVDKDGKKVLSKTVLVNFSNYKTVTVIYPNPAKNIFHIQTTGKSTFILTDQQGKVYITKTINENGEIDVSQLTAGLYYLKNKETDVIQKIIVTK